MLDRALELFLERGFAGTSIEAITGAAGMAKRTVYARYGDKASLFRAAITRGIERLNLSNDRLASAEKGDIEETLSAVAALLIEIFTSHDGMRLIRLVRSDAVSFPEIAEEFSQRATAPTRAYLCGLMRDRLSCADKDEEILADLFLDLVARGPATLAARGVALDPAALDRRTRLGVRIFLHGVEAHARPEGSGGGRTISRLLRDAEARLDEARQSIVEAGRRARSD